ncbi:MAG: hypothetical protein KatS3mg131_0385 [Candidatus Tectimicrobiota bacterium]|nr:MAG: hypothetical protein KatS3mg131_0385 [Candidatus Tectomicrobia bacterium]
MPSEPRWTRRLLVAPVRAVTAVPWAAVWLAVALAGAALWVTATRLEFETSRNALMAAHSRSVQVYRQLKSAFPNLDAFIVVVAASHPERGKRFVDALAARLAADERHFGEIVARFDTSSLEGKKLLLLSPEKLGGLAAAPGGFPGAAGRLA